MKKRLLGLLSILLAALVLSGYVIKETKLGENISFYVNVGGTQREALRISSVDGTVSAPYAGFSGLSGPATVPIGGTVAIFNHLSGAWAPPATGVIKDGFMRADGATVSAQNVTDGCVFPQGTVLPNLQTGGTGGQGAYLVGCGSAGCNSSSSTVGSNSYTPAGSVGTSITGSQSIAHTHGIAHVHQWMFFNASAGGTADWYSRTVADSSTTSIAASTSGGQSSFASFFDHTFTDGAVHIDFWDPRSPSESSGTDDLYYTTGVLAAPSGSGTSAASGGMSANATVNGSNFSLASGTLTGTAGENRPSSLPVVWVIRVK